MSNKKRSTYYTSKGNKRYLKRNKEGQIVDNQSYKKAHGQDIKMDSQDELKKEGKI
jgi:hypothetical protein